MTKSVLDCGMNKGIKRDFSSYAHGASVPGEPNSIILRRFGSGKKRRALV